MNRQFLGDALDHWKGSVFEGLGGCLMNFRVDAMASDAERWKRQDWSLYANLLRTQPEKILYHRYSLVRDRNAYFKEISGGCDLFLDPDTGIKTSRVKEPYKYLCPKELLALLNTDRNRVVIVYQHIRGKKTRERVEQVLEVIRLHKQEFYCTSYESGTVALLFFSMTRRRVKAIADSFVTLLGSHAKSRIGLFKLNKTGRYLFS